MRFAVVGLGWAARGFHLPALKSLPGALVVAGCDAREDQRDSWQRETGIPAFSSYEEMLSETGPEAVVVATPPDSHADLALRALAAGAHVICEKPFVSTVAEADRVLAAASAAARFVAVNHEFREKPIFRALVERIGSAEAGRLVFCQIWQLMDLAPWSEPVPWRAAMPNRTLFEGGTHLVDLLFMLFGEQRPAGVYARHSSGLDRSRQADAIHLVTLDYHDGRLAHVLIDRLCPSGTQYVEVRADCERESLRASHGGRALIWIGKKRAEQTGARVELGLGGLAWAERGLRRKTLARSPRQPGVHATTQLMHKIAAALEAGREPPSSGRQAREVLAVIEAAYRSAQTGMRVELDGGSGAEVSRSGSVEAQPAPAAHPGSSASSPPPGRERGS